MKRLKLLGLATLTILALTAMAMAGTATALEVLPTPSAEKPVKFTDKGGSLVIPTLKDALEPIECKKNKSKGEFTSTTLGKVEVTLEECKTVSTKATCTGLGDKTTGNITFKAEVHFTDGLLTEKEVPTLAILTTEVIHLTCGGILLVEVLAKGCSAAHILEESLDKLVSVIHAEWLLKEKIHGDPDIPFINLPTESECGLLLRANEGTEFMGAIEGLEEIENCEQGGVKCTFLLHTK